MNLAEALNHLADTLRTSGDAKAFVLVVAELERLRGIEQRAREIAEQEPRDPVDAGDVYTARHILGEPT